MNRLKRKSAQNYERLSAFQTSPIHTWFKLPSLRNSRPSCDEGSMHSLNSVKYLPQMKEPDNATDLTIRQITLHGCNDFGWSLRLERDDFSSNRHPALSFCLSMISAQTRSAFVARENRYPPSGRGPRACFSGSCRLLFQNACSDIHGGGAVEPSKAAVEIGKVAKADVVGDRADLLFPGPGLAEHAVGAGEAPPEQEGRKRGAIVLKQSLQMARRHAEMRGDGADRNFPMVEVLGNIRLCRFQSCRPHAPISCNVGGFAGSSEREHCQIVHVSRNPMSKRRRPHLVIITQQGVGVACQQLERGRIRRDVTHDCIIDINDRRRQYRVWNSNGDGFADGVA